MRLVFGILRIGIAAAVVAAIIGQLQSSVAYWESEGVTDLSTQFGNFFSLFVIEASILTVVLGLVGAVLLFRRKGADPDLFTFFRAGVTTYMVIGALIYNVLLRGLEMPEGAVLGWANEVLHVVAPVYLLVDWLLAPGRTPIAMRRLWGILVFPVIWAVVVIIRGPLIADPILGNDYWYPYPFLDYNTAANGYFSMVSYIIFIGLSIAAIAAGLLWLPRRKALVKS